MNFRLRNVDIRAFGCSGLAFLLAGVSVVNVQTK